VHGMIFNAVDFHGEKSAEANVQGELVPGMIVLDLFE